MSSSSGSDADSGRGDSSAQAASRTWRSKLNQFLTEVTWSTGSSLRRVVDIIQGPTAMTRSTAWLMGVQYGSWEGHALSDEDLQLLLADFRSHIWCTYRREFVPLGVDALTSDVGWGCTLRSGQMMMAEAVLRHALGRSWRQEYWGSGNSPASQQQLMKVLSLLLDHPHAALSIHRICTAGEAHGVVAGRWLGPWALCKALASLMNSTPQLGLVLHVVCDPGGGAPSVNLHQLLGLMQPAAGAGTAAGGAPGTSQPVAENTEGELVDATGTALQGHSVRSGEVAAPPAEHNQPHQHHATQEQQQQQHVQQQHIGRQADDCGLEGQEGGGDEAPPAAPAFSLSAGDERPAGQQGVLPASSLSVAAAAEHAAAAAHPPPISQPLVQPPDASSVTPDSTQQGADQQPCSYLLEPGGVPAAAGPAALPAHSAAAPSTSSPPAEGSQQPLSAPCMCAPDSPAPRLSQPAVGDEAVGPQIARQHAQHERPAREQSWEPVAQPAYDIIADDTSAGSSRSVSPRTDDASIAAVSPRADDEGIVAVSCSPGGSAHVEALQLQEEPQPGRPAALPADTGTAVHHVSQPMERQQPPPAPSQQPPSVAVPVVGTSEEVSQQAATPGLVLLLPLTLGVGKANPVYHAQLQRVLTFPQSIGIVGGRPSASLYFVGWQEQHLLYLDPHVPQQSGLRPHTYFCDTLRLLPIGSIDPSLAIGFYCRCAADVMDLVQRLEALAEDHCKAPIVTVEGADASHQGATYSRHGILPNARADGDTEESWEML